MKTEKFSLYRNYEIKCLSFFPETENVTSVTVGVHGFAGDKDSSMLRKLGKKLSELGGALICFDFPCHGESPAGEDLLTVQNCIDDLSLVADHVRNNYPHAKKNIFATSFGGYISLLASEKLYDFDFILRAPAVTMPVILLETVLKTERATFEELGTVRCGFERKMDLPFSFLLDLEAQIDTKKKPLDGRALIIHGTLDTVVPPSHVLEYCGAHPKVRLHLMEGADHRFKNAGELDCICDTAIDFIYN